MTRNEVLKLLEPYNEDDLIHQGSSLLASGRKTNGTKAG